MPELEQKIAAWRARLAKELDEREDVLDELEAHARDGAEALMRNGLTPDEAFDRMMIRFGDLTRVAAEFQLLPAPVLRTLGLRGAKSLAYLSGIVGLAGFIYFLTFSTWRVMAVARTQTLPVNPAWPTFWFGMAVVLTIACFAAIRASNRFLTRRDMRDLRGLVAFNLLGFWMMLSWAVARLPIPYPTNAAIIWLMVVPLVLVWRRCCTRSHPLLEVSP